MFEDADNFADIFRGGLPYYLLITLPILIICSSNPVLSSSEFTVHRMSQFDVGGVSYGCRASAINLEAKSMYTWSTSRHCVTARFNDLTIDKFNEIRSKAGGLIILLPKDISKLNFEEKEHLFLLEQAMMSQVSSIPVYFSTYNNDLDKVIEDITATSYDAIKSNSKSTVKARESALSDIIGSVSANGYQIVVSGSSHVPSKQSKISIIQGELAPLKNFKPSDDIINKLPLIIIAAHLNTFGLYNDYPDNSDTAVLLTLADLFSKLHNTVNAAPKYRLMFLLSESGALLNYQGMKKWLDENSQIQNVDFVLCLDTITMPLAEDTSELYMHVSKPPKDGTSMSNFYKQLKSTGIKYDNVTIDGVHKKINLADTQLAWEHERFSMKRLPAFTLSSLKTHKESERITSFKNNPKLVLKNSKKVSKIIAESLARYIYNIEDGEIFSHAIHIENNIVKPWLQVKSALHNNDLKNGFEKYLKNVKIIYEKPDIREPDFMLYEGQEALLNFYRVKPAIFDLFLTILIGSYLTSVYFIIQYFPHIYTFACKMSKASGKIKTN